MVSSCCTDGKQWQAWLLDCLTSSGFASSGGTLAASKKHHVFFIIRLFLLSYAMMWEIWLFELFYDITCYLHTVLKQWQTGILGLFAWSGGTRTDWCQTITIMTFWTIVQYWAKLLTHWSKQLTIMNFWTITYPMYNSNYVCQWQTWFFILDRARPVILLLLSLSLLLILVVVVVQEYR